MFRPPGIFLVNLHQPGQPARLDGPVRRVGTGQLVRGRPDAELRITSDQRNRGRTKGFTPKAVGNGVQQHRDAEQGRMTTHGIFDSHEFRSG